MVGEKQTPGGVVFTVLMYDFCVQEVKCGHEIYITMNKSLKSLIKSISNHMPIFLEYIIQAVSEYNSIMQFSKQYFILWNQLIKSQQTNQVASYL